MLLLFLKCFLLAVTLTGTWHIVAGTLCRRNQITANIQENQPFPAAWLVTLDSMLWELFSELMQVLVLLSMCPGLTWAHKVPDSSACPPCRGSTARRVGDSTCLAFCYDPALPGTSWCNKVILLQVGDPFQGPSAGSYLTGKRMEAKPLLGRGALREQQGREPRTTALPRGLQPRGFREWGSFLDCLWPIACSWSDSGSSLVAEAPLSQDRFQLLGGWLSPS